MFGLIRSRLRVKMALAFALASVLPILGAGILTVKLMEDAVRDDAARRHRAMAELGGALVRDFISRGNEKLTTVSRLLEKELTEQKVGKWNDENRAYRETVVDRLNRLVEPPDIYLELQYYAQGKEPQSVGQVQRSDYQNRQMVEPQGQQKQQEQIASNTLNDLVRKPMYGNEAFINPQLEDNLDFRTLPLSVPVGRGKSTLGALVAYLDFGEVDELLDSVAEGGYLVTLENGAGEKLAGAGEVTGDTLGDTRAAGHSDWTVTVREPARKVYATVAQVRGQASLWIALALLIAIALSLGISRRIVQPVAALTNAAQRMESGDLKARAEIRRNDEIGRLGHAFDRMASALERLDEAKSEFVANVSHELRTPLTSIRLSIANLLDGVVGPLDDRQQSTLQRLRGDVDRMIVMVNDLLEMARLEAGAVQPQRKAIDLVQLARGCAARIEPLAGEKKIGVKVQGEGSVEADPDMIDRVLSNLVDNAVKFTPEGGQVTVTVSDGGFEVRDTGPGTAVEGLFEKFAQGKEEGVKHRGAGLGLAIVKKLVDLHGGSIEVKNENGAVFTVRL